MDRVAKVRQLIKSLNEQEHESKPLHEVLAENRQKQDIEFQQRYQQRTVYHALDESDNQWLKKVKESSQAKEAELQREIAQGLKKESKKAHKAQPVTLPTGRVKKKKSSLIK